MTPLLATIKTSNPYFAEGTRRYLTRIAEARGQAIYQVDGQLNKYVHKPNGPYSEALDTIVWEGAAEQGTLGDFWSDVGSAFATSIGTGLSAKIGGATNPQPAPGAIDYDLIAKKLKESQAPTPVAAPFPTWAKAALIGAGALSLLFIIKRA